MYWSVFDLAISTYQVATFNTYQLDRLSSTRHINLIGSMTDDRPPSHKQDQYMLRFPDGMRETIKARAAEHGRSMNAEIVALIQSALSEADTAKKSATFVREMVEFLLKTSESDPDFIEKTTKALRKVTERGHGEEALEQVRSWTPSRELIEETLNKPSKPK